MEIPSKKLTVYPEILIDINRINIRDKEVFFQEKKRFSNDMILFDLNKANEFIEQYKRFEINFEDMNYFSKIEKERKKHYNLLNYDSVKFCNYKSKSCIISDDKNWIFNYFFPINILNLIKGKKLYNYLINR